ncbi:MAG TPA: hypothetical protein VGN97_23905 [Mesorhizobium sp.]|nr:hypothetical protein [Mesorhizobium sp.]
MRAEAPPSVPTQGEQNAFEAAQWAMLSSAGTALQQLGLRAAAGAPDLSRLVRKRQDLVALAGLREDEMQSADDAARMVALRGEIDSIRAEIAGIDATLAEDFPRYAELANPAPLSIAAVQSLLEDDEGLVVVLGGKDDVFTFAVTRESFAWSRTGYGAWLLAEEVQALRAQLDPNSAQDRGARPLREDPGPRIAAFERGRAHFLYRALLGGVAPALSGKRHLFTVADGPFASLPFSLLVSLSRFGRQRPTTSTQPRWCRKPRWMLLPSSRKPPKHASR